MDARATVTRDLVTRIREAREDHMEVDAAEAPDRAEAREEDETYFIDAINDLCLAIPINRINRIVSIETVKNKLETNEATSANGPRAKRGRMEDILDTLFEGDLTPEDQDLLTALSLLDFQALYEYPIEERQPDLLTTLLT